MKGVDRPRVALRAFPNLTNVRENSEGALDLAVRIGLIPNLLDAEYRRACREPQPVNGYHNAGFACKTLQIIRPRLN